MLDSGSVLCSNPTKAIGFSVDSKGGLEFAFCLV